jgi:hypothetical protein
MRKLLRELKREFPWAKVEIANSGHYRLRLPNGKSVFIAATPSCWHFLSHVRADVKRQMRNAEGAKS